MDSEKDYDKWLRKSFKEEEEDNDNKDGIVKVEDGNETCKSGEVLAIVQHLSEAINKVKNVDKRGAKEAFELAKKEFQAWMGSNTDGPSTMATQAAGDDDDDSDGDEEDEDSSKIKVGDWVTIGELVPMLERDQDDDSGNVGNHWDDDDDPKHKLVYTEALFVREGYLMPKDWDKNKTKSPPSKKKRENEGSVEVPMLKEFYFQPYGSRDKILSGDIPHWREQRDSLEDYRETAEEVNTKPQWGKPGRLIKKDFLAEGAYLLPIMGGGCSGDWESGEFLWARLSIF